MDDLSGVDPASVRLLLDGTDRTTSAQVTAAGTNFTPSAPLPDGSHVASLSVRDLAGNLAQASWGFTTDVTPPRLLITSPSSGTVATVSLTLAVSYSDATSGVDLTSLHIVLDGGELTSSCQVATAAATCTSAPLKAGPHALAASLRDRAGNQANASLAFQVVLDTTPPTITFISPTAAASLLATATPTIRANLSDDLSGVAPGSIRLILDGSDVTASSQVSASSVVYTPAQRLADGLHVATVQVSDQAGNHAGASEAFTIDTVPPTISYNTPTSEVISGDGSLAVSLAFADATSGINEQSLTLAVNGVNALSTCTIGLTSALCQLQGLASGQHGLLATILDLAGNQASATLAFKLTVDLLPPTVAITSPSSGAVISSNPITVTGTANDDGQVAALVVNGQSVPLQNGTFSTSVALAEGFNQITVKATDTTGKTASAAVDVTLDTTPPVIAVAAPSPGQLTNQAQVRVSGTVSDSSGVAQVTLNGLPASVSGSQFSGTVALGEGSNTIAVHAVDVAGNAADANVSVTRYSLPSVAITSPQDLSFLAATTVDVAGTVSDSGGQVQVNGLPATLAGTSFVARAVPLVEGGNLLTAVITDHLGHASSATINVVRDLTPPHLSLDVPGDRAIVSTDSVHISGLVNDIVAGTVNTQQVTVLVNGVQATVANRAFDVQVPLQLGDNTVQAVATDESGNSAQAQITVTSVAPSGPRVEIVSGDGQAAAIGAALGAPLIARVLNVSGMGVQGVPLTYRVRGGDGIVTGGRRDAVVISQADGTAQVQFTLGSHAGAGNQRVEVSAVLYGAPVTFVETALPGAPAFVFADSGGNQYGVAGPQLPRPLVAVVTDAGFNRLPGVPVLVSHGAGRRCASQRHEGAGLQYRQRRAGHRAGGAGSS